MSLDIERASTGGIARRVDLGNVSIGFIGFGNMAQAIAIGLLRAEAVPGEHMHACARTWDKLSATCERLGTVAHRTAAEVVEASDVVFVAVKPHLVEEVCAPLAKQLARKVVVSVAFGVAFEDYERFLEPGTHHVSCVPNTPVSVCEGVWAVEREHSLDAADLALVGEILGATGQVVFMETRLLGVAGTVTGCGPAFVAMFMEALGDAAVKHGVGRAQAYELVAQTVAGTGKLMRQTGQHPGVLKDAVCSPGGTTIKGVAALEHAAFRSAVVEAIDAILG